MDMSDSSQEDSVMPEDLDKIVRNEYEKGQNDSLSWEMSDNDTK